MQDTEYKVAITKGSGEDDSDINEQDENVETGLKAAEDGEGMSKVDKEAVHYISNWYVKGSYLVWRYIINITQFNFSQLFE